MEGVDVDVAEIAAWQMAAAREIASGDMWEEVRTVAMPSMSAPNSHAKCGVSPAWLRRLLWLRPRRILAPAQQVTMQHVTMP